MSTDSHGSLPLPSIRFTNLFIVAACTFAVFTAVLYFQKMLQLTPCPLCITQRVFIMMIGFTAFAAFAHHPKYLGRRVYASMGFIVAVIGSGISARHIWLQNLPEELVPACGPGLTYMFETMPLFDALKVLFQGDGDCAETVWSLFSISIPGWTLIAFAGLATVNIWQFVRNDRRDLVLAAVVD
ncbi:disulfide bond formation protein B [Teredinibacter haidensis]|mgnify:CR=1 FL=1|uniref:disulfide bond formation protein B n=1 Tax=Teredinibacter haidensis TaxID=2731755 RepID=UPI000948942A|nr:disulfide bond formation protein B [Teredinibacter haidensis]